jgi:hypothetical protein
MALINCPECGASVSDQAEKCPNCAYPINKAETIKPQPTKITPPIIVKPKEGCFLQTLNTGCMVVAIITVIIVLIIFFGLCSQ